MRQGRSAIGAAPQPIAYQGSKRQLVPAILAQLPADTETLIEPFVGSGAVTIAAAWHGRARQFVMGDTLQPLVELWRRLLAEPEQLADGYAALWHAQLADPRGHYLRVRQQFNAERQPAQLLYLLARCVKSAVRFNAQGAFNQSADHRRLGTRPDTQRAKILTTAAVLAGRTETHHGDYAALLERAGPRDVVYMDPPYLGVSRRRDARYVQGLDLQRFVANLERANARGTAYLVSLDGRSGARTYGPGLPAELGLQRMELTVGRSSQATLLGRSEETVEALYLSPALLGRTRPNNSLHYGA